MKKPKKKTGRVSWARGAWKKKGKKKKDLPKGSNRNAGWLAALLCLLLPCSASSFEVTTSSTCSPTGCFHSPLINRTVCDCHGPLDLDLAAVSARPGVVSALQQVWPMQQLEHAAWMQQLELPFGLAKLGSWLDSWARPWTWFVALASSGEACSWILPRFGRSIRLYFTRLLQKPFLDWCNFNCVTCTVLLGCWTAYLNTLINIHSLPVGLAGCGGLVAWVSRQKSQKRILEKSHFMNPKDRWLFCFQKTLGVGISFMIGYPWIPPQFTFLTLWLGIGLLGEFFYQMIWWCTFVDDSETTLTQMVRGIRGFRAWKKLISKPGPWNQAFQHMLATEGIRPARIARKQRVVGIHGARGLGGCFRFGPLRGASQTDRTQIRKCRSALDRICLNSHQSDTGLLRDKDHEVLRQVRSHLDWFKTQHLYRHDLRGGMAGGSRATRRKREEQLEDPSLVSALSGFLQQWQAQNVGAPAKKRRADGARHRQSGENCGTWQNRWTSSHDTAYSKNDSSLVDELLAFLSNCQTQRLDDYTVASQLQEWMSDWTQPSRQRTDVRVVRRWQKPTENRQVSVGRHGVSDVNQCEWSLPVKIMTKGHFLKQLPCGRAPEGNLISVKTIDDFYEIKDMKVALDNYDPVAILIDGVHDVGQKVQVSLKRGPQRMKFEQVTYVALGTPSHVPSPRPPTVANVKKFQPPAKVSVRISAPAHYREAYLKPYEWDSAKSVLLELAQLKLAPASVWTGGSWQWNTVQRHHTLVGHMKLAPQLAQALESHSGRRGIFITTTGVAKKHEQVKWLTRGEEADHDGYLRHCISEASSRKQNLKLRMGGGNDIGLLYLPSENIDARPIQVLVQGVPRNWDETDLEDFLKEQGWEKIQPISRRHARQSHVSWIVKAVAPNGSVANVTPSCTWHYVDNDDTDFQIYVSKQVGRFPKPQHVYAVDAPRKSFAKDKPASKPVIDIPDTIMDTDDERKEESVTPHGHEDADKEKSRSRSPCRAVRRVIERGTPSPRVAQHSVQPAKDEIEVLKEKGYQVVDLGGQGDCGFRAVAAGIEYNKDPTKVISPENAKTQGAKLRGMAVTYCRKHVKEFLPFFCKDINVPPEEPSVECQRVFSEWIDEMVLPRTWIDGLALKSLTGKTGSPIIIWRFSDNHWNRVTLAPSFNTDGWARAARGAKPVVLLLKDAHYTWLKPPDGENVPESWLKETSVPDRKELQGSGKPKRVSSDMAPSVRTVVPAAADAVPAAAGAFASASASSLVAARALPAAPASLPSEVSGEVTPSVHSLLSPTRASLPSSPIGKKSVFFNSPLKKLRRMKAASPGSGAATPSVHSLAPALRLRSKTSLPASASAPPTPLVRAAGPQGECPSQTASFSQNGGQVKCSSWEQAESWLSAIVTALADPTTEPAPVATLQKCLLACSSITRNINDALTSIPAVSTNISSTKRKRVQDRADPPPPKKFSVWRDAKDETHDETSEKFRWKCNLCSFETITDKKERLYGRRCTHIAQAHPGQRDQVQKVSFAAPLIPVKQIPMQDRAWTCAKCGLGLPWAPSSQIQRSRDAHLARCAPGISATENRKKLRSQPKKKFLAYQQMQRNHQGWHNEAWRQKRVEEARTQGHDLQFFGKPELVKHSRLKFTCARCKAISSHTSNFSSSPCTPRTTCRSLAWKALRLNQDDDMGSLLKCWAWTQAQTQEFDERVYSSKRCKTPAAKVRPLQSRPWFKQLPESQPQKEDGHRDPQPGEPGADSRLGGQRGCRVGEASNPGPRAKQRWGPLKLLSLNTAGRENVWTCMNQIQPRDAQVICLQEVSMNDNDFRAISHAMFRKGWISYFAKGQSTGRARDAPIGGCLTFVHTGIPSKQVISHVSPGGQALAVQIGRYVVFNMYACHHDERPDFLCELFSSCQAMHRDDWLLVGDFNSLPSESLMVTALINQGAQLVVPPETAGGSRWGNPRVIDFGVTNMHTLPHWEFLPERWSDHRAFVLTWPQKPNKAEPTWEMVPCNRYMPRNSEDYVKWTQVLTSQWAQHGSEWCAEWDRFQPDSSSPHGLQASVNDMWAHMNLFLESFLQKSVQVAQAQGIQMFDNRRPHRLKGTKPRLRQKEQHVRPAYGDAAPNQLRQRQRLLGRLLERDRCRGLGVPDDEMRPLLRKIHRHPNFHPDLRVSDLKEEIQTMTMDFQQQRLRQWKEHLRSSDKAVYKWLRQKPVPPNMNVFDDDAEALDAEATAEANEVLHKLLVYWQRIWNRPHTERPPHEYLSQYGPPREPQVQWEPVTAQELFQAAKKQRGKAGGCDGWLGTELSCFPIQLWNDVAPFLQFCERHGTFPRAFQEVHQVFLPKGGAQRQSDKATAVSKLRPISLLSTWWRTWSSARVASTATQTWIDRHLPPSQAGARRGRDAASTFVEIASQYAQGHYVGTLDLTKAFDHIRPSTAIDTLDWYGWPLNLAQAIIQVWGAQNRWFSWWGSCNRRPTRVTSSIPQGDALSPTVMNFLLAAPMRHIAQQSPESQLFGYVDDRSWTSPTPGACEAVFTQWQEHSTQLGLVENPRKAQISHKTPDGRRRLEARPALGPHVVKEMVILGSMLYVGKATDFESERVQKAFSCASKVQFVPVAPQRRLIMVMAAASSKAVYGWLARTPTAKLVQKLETRLKQAHFNHRMASVDLTRLLLGHRLDLRFSSGHDALGATWRAAKRRARALTDWGCRHGPAQRLNTWLQNLGWDCQDRWTWSHPDIQNVICLDPQKDVWEPDLKVVQHAVRESWRRKRWHSYMHSTRHEVTDLQAVQYDESRVTFVRNLASKATTHEVAVLTGAFVSPLLLKKAHPDTFTGACPFCNHPVGSFEHVTWMCNKWATLPVWHDNMEKRLGWPTARTTEALKHIAKVRALVLTDRWGH